MNYRDNEKFYEDVVYLNIVECCKKFRIKNTLSQEDLARKFRVKKNSIINFENCRNKSLPILYYYIKLSFELNENLIEQINDSMFNYHIKSDIEVPF